MLLGLTGRAEYFHVFIDKKKIFLNTFPMPGTVLTEVRGIKTHRMVSFFKGFTISEEEMNTQAIQYYSALCYVPTGRKGLILL